MSEHIFESTACAPISASKGLASLATERLNSKCFCVSLDEQALRDALTSQLGSLELSALVAERCPFLFSARPVFISARQTERMKQVVAAVEAVVALPAYQEYVLERAPAIARHNTGRVKGVFFGYDFHLRGDDIGLIEINTNAGGAMLNAVMARAHRACSFDTEQLAEAAASGAIFEDRIVNMFQAEWERGGRGRALKSIAIVDTAPEEQYLYPEFLLFQRLFERHFVRTIITGASELTFRDGALWHGDLAVDLVYNRLTDFMLESSASAALRAAYLDDAIVLTPHPRAHALFADKRNLALLSNASLLQELEVPLPVQEILLANILHTEVVDAANGERLWSERRKLFFKPNAGFGGRAAYRGDKITKRVWQEILAGEYVAQAIMVPGVRVNGSQQNAELLKFDLRLYAYDGATQWVAARVYQGQTTNFRTPGGGFAPVYGLPDDDTNDNGLSPLALSNDSAACCANNCW